MKGEPFKRFAPTKKGMDVNMKKKEWNEGLDHLDPALVEKYVAQKEELAQKKRQRAVWLRWGALAACLAVIVGVALSALKPPKVPVWEDAIYSAEDIAKWFGAAKYDGVATNAYTKVYVPDAKYLYIDEIPDVEYLDIYRRDRKKMEIDKKEFVEFVDGFLPKLASALHADIPQYEIKERTNSDGNRLDIYEDMGTCWMSIGQWETDSFIWLYGKSDVDLNILDGETIRIDHRLSDEEIIQSMQPVRDVLFDIFGVSFSETKIVRRYDPDSKYGSPWIEIYFYNKEYEESYLPVRTSAPEYIAVRFDTPANDKKDIGSNSILTAERISYYKERVGASNQFLPIATAKKISLADAEALLYNGYVFGGHSCPLCMAAQDKVSFEGYEYVDIEYVFGYDAKAQTSIAFPFYAFYKKIGDAPNGNAIYAKTYVAAIEVSGYDAYFQNQTSNHRNALTYEEVTSD